MKFKNVKEGMFFYRTDRGSMLYVEEKGKYNLTAYVYDKRRKELIIDSYNIARWEKTIWGVEKEAPNPKYVASSMLIGLFTEIEKVNYGI